MWDYKIKINTPENTQLEFELAGIGNRFLAFLIDNLIIFLFIFIIYLIMGIIYLIFSDTILESIGEFFLALILFGVFFLTFNGFFILFEFFWNGQTPGKRLLNIRVIRENGQPVGFIEVFIRNIFRIVDYMVGPYFVLFSKKEKRIGDYLTRTIIVKEKELSAPLADFDEATEIKETIPNISRLTPQDFSMLGSFFHRYEDFDTEAKETLLNEFCSLYIQKLSLDELSQILVSQMPEKRKYQLLSDIYNTYKQRGTT